MIGGRGRRHPDGRRCRRATPPSTRSRRRSSDSRCTCPHPASTSRSAPRGRRPGRSSGTEAPPPWTPAGAETLRRRTDPARARGLRRPARPYRPPGPDPDEDVTDHASMTIPTPAPSDKFSFGLWTVAYPGRDPFGEPDARRDGPRLRARAPRRHRRLRRQLPRRRPDPVRLRRRVARRDHRALEEGARRHRPRRHDRHHQPVHAPGLQGRRLHVQRPRRPSLRDPQGHAQHRPRRRARRQGLRLLGRPRGRRVGCGQGRRRGARPLPRGVQRARRVRARQGLRHQVRDRAQAQRAPRRHPAADDRPRAGVHRDARPLRERRASTPRSGTRRWPASTPRTATRRHCGRASSSTSTSTVRAVRATTRTSASVPATSAAPSGSSTRSWPGGYDGPVHFDFKTPRTEDDDGVWVAAAAA